MIQKEIEYNRWMEIGQTIKITQQLEMMLVEQKARVIEHITRILAEQEAKNYAV